MNNAYNACRRAFDSGLNLLLSTYLEGVDGDVNGRLSCRALILKKTPITPREIAPSLIDRRAGTKTAPPKVPL